MIKAISKRLLWIIDKLLDPLEYLILKPLKINTNTFFSYVFGLLAIYLTVDRGCELISLLLTGQCINYWTPLQYSLVYLAIVAGYAITCGSPLNTTLKHPMKFFVFYSICGYIIILAMAAQWINEALWLVCSHFSNFKYIAANMPNLIGPAFSLFCLLLSTNFVSSFCSKNVFHSLQAGHFPNHFADSYPQLLQTNTDFGFAIFSCMIYLK